MTGLLFIFVVGLWAALIWALTRWITRRIASKNMRRLAGALFVLLVAPLPVADEIVGGFQFRALCNEGATLKIDAEKIRGKRVRIVFSPKAGPELVENTRISILRHHYSYRNTDNGEEYASYETFVAKGGWLIQALKISNTNTPLTISPSYCGPINEGSLNKKYGFEIQN